MMGETNLDSMSVRRVAMDVQLNSSKPTDIRYIEAENGTWELLPGTRYYFSTNDVTLTIVLQLPPHIHMVYRQSNPHRTELIAKHLRRGSNELDILKYLHAIQLQSPHTIWLIETIPPITRGWFILLELHSVRDQRFVDSHGVHGHVQRGQGLIYLHKHRIAH
ncbi:hypothetical protein H4582DRAFT_253238 [Lactarius indigo]|nr:hypothetical protein H4582DRAFT_253238 [Lactarius indigo]